MDCIQKPFSQASSTTNATIIRPTFDVAICTAGRRPTVVSAVESIINCSDSWSNIVVIDQCGDSATYDALSDSALINRVQYVPTRTQGISAARNIALNICRSDIVLFTDDDCVVDSNWINGHRDVFESRIDVAISFGQVLPVSHDSSSGYIPSFMFSRSRATSSVFRDRPVRGMGANMAVRRQIAIDLGGFDEGLNAAEDRDLALRGLLAGHEVFECAGSVVRHSGFRAWDEGRHHTRSDWYEIGAMCAKPVRSGHWEALPFVIGEFVVHALLPFASAVATFRTRRGVTRIVAFLHGYSAGLGRHVDRKSLLYQRAIKGVATDDERRTKSGISTKSTLSKPTLLTVATSTGFGGMERVMLSLSSIAKEQGIEPLLLLTDNAEAVATLNAAEFARVRSVVDDSVPDTRRERSVRDIGRLARVIRTYGPDVIHLHYGTGHIPVKDLIAAKLSGTRRIIVSVHSDPLWDRTNSRSKSSTRLASSLCDRIAVFSHAVRLRLLEAGVSESKIEVLPIATPPNIQLKKDECRKMHGLPEDAIVVATAARLVPDKGIGALIDALSPIIAANARVRLLVAGDGPERKRLEEQAKKLPVGAVVFTGHLHEVGTVYASADIFALPSESEGFGLVYIEAAAYGVPAVGFRVGGVPEAVLDGETGILTSPHDVTALTTALSQLIGDEPFRQRLGAAAQMRARSHFNTKRLADAYMDLLGYPHGAG